MLYSNYIIRHAKVLQKVPGFHQEMTGNCKLVEFNIDILFYFSKNSFISFSSSFISQVLPSVTTFLWLAWKNFAKIYISAVKLHNIKTKPEIIIVLVLECNTKKIDYELNGDFKYCKLMISASIKIEVITILALGKYE